VVTTTPPAIPVAPALPTATLITPNGLTLNWNAVAGATGYTVYQNGVALPAVAGTSVTRTGLTASTSYTFTVVATNAGGSSAQSPVLTVATTTVAATTPANTSVTMLPETRGALGTGSFTLNWSPVQGATSYVVYQNGVMLPLVAGVATSRSLTLVSGTSYNFRVAYRNSLNVLSAPSAIQTVKAP
jgi:chitodextrinase